jgi:hypothetical protein
MASLKKGDQGSEVGELQRLLRKRGYQVAVDGDFGRKTWEAVRAFQSQHLDAHGQPLVVDGKVGPVTWWALTNPKPQAAEIPVDFGKMPSAAAGGSGQGRKALSIAISELKRGAGEAGGNNRGADVRRYLAPVGLTEPNSWCAAFVSWCFLQACKGDQGRMPFAYSASARALLKQFRDRDAAERLFAVAWRRRGLVARAGRWLAGTCRPGTSCSGRDALHHRGQSCFEGGGFFSRAQPDGKTARFRTCALRRSRDDMQTTPRAFFRICSRR